jgi:ribosomal protein S6
MALRYYEAMFLFDSTEATKDWAACVSSVENILKKQNSVIIKLDKWDDRKLAYDIGNAKRGTYLLSMFQCEPTGITQIKRDLELSELVLRNMILEDEELLAKVEERAELKKKREAEAAQAAAEGLPVEGDRERRFGDRDRDRGDRPRYPRRERVPAADVEMPSPEEMGE